MQSVVQPQHPNHASAFDGGLNRPPKRPASLHLQPQNVKRLKPNELAFTALSSNSAAACLSPSLPTQPHTLNLPPSLLISSPGAANSETDDAIIKQQQIRKLDDFVWFGKDETFEIYEIRHNRTGETLLLKMLPLEKFKRLQTVSVRLSQTIPNVDDGDCFQRFFPAGTEMFVEQSTGFVVQPAHYGDLHAYVRAKRRLPEAEARRLFAQIVDMVAYAHRRGVALRDIKLRRLVFVDEAKTQLRFDFQLEDAAVFTDVNGDDTLGDRFGCPAYVCPEIICAGPPQYSALTAEMWSLGVVLYILVVGRYPFYDPTPSGLFSRIRVGQYYLPESLVISSRLRYLIKALIRMNPSERPNIEELRQHPWLRLSAERPDIDLESSDDALVPNVVE